MTGQTAVSEERREPRHEVLYRTRLFRPGEASRSAVLVNISPRGFMARTEDAHAPGHRLTVELPGLGMVAAEVRWALGGRIGCRLDRVIGLADYHRLLQALLRG